MPSRLPVSLAGHPVVAAQAAAVQVAAAAQAVALEQLREKLESGEPPEKKMALVTDEQQRLMQRALQQNLLAMTAQLPMSIRINSQGTRSPGQCGRAVRARGWAGGRAARPGGVPHLRSPRGREPPGLLRQPEQQRHQQHQHVG